ncbi:uncharacterized protein LOC143468783 [Clavelina lepadiformis]|uniref:uncharacterized protein LOC143468783 n=1 Tax=Clavelina lepadiformis TaxID=159417 RepID=UPI004041682A
MTIVEQKTPALDAVPASIEAKFAQRLAANEKKIRDRAFKKLRQYMLAKSVQPGGGFTRDELIKIWKGLFYCMWMSDKPLVQEELAISMAELLPLLRNVKTSMLYFETFLATMHREWRGIDRLRMDKFYLLIRFMFQQALVCIKNSDWEEGLLDWFLSVLRNGPICSTYPGPNQSTGPPVGIRLHFADVYLEELTTYGHEDLTSEKVNKCLMPYCMLICNTPIKELRNRVLDKIFNELIDQSDAAIDLMKEVEGMDDVDAPEDRLRINYDAVADILFDLANKPEAMGKNRKQVYKLIKKLREVGRGRVPLDDLPDLLPDDPSASRKKIESDLTKRLANDMENEFKNRLQEKKKNRKLRKKMKKNERDEEQNTEPDEHEFDVETNGSQDNMNVENVVEVVELHTVVKPKKKKNKVKKGNDSINKTSNDAQPFIRSALSMEEMMSLDVKLSDVVDSSITELSPKSKSTKKDRNVKKTDEICAIDLAKKTFTENDLNKNHERPSKLALSHSGKKNKKNMKRKHMKDELMKKLAMEENGDCGVTDCEIQDSEPNAERSLKKLKLGGDGDNENHSDQNTDKSIGSKTGFAAFSQSIAPTAAFFKVAVSKANKIPKKAAVKEVVKEEHNPVKSSSGKKVSFEMSKIQVQPFKKNDRSSVLSPSPLTVAFDPRKTPDFGVLKARKTPSSIAKFKNMPPKKRASASDFF